MDTAIGKYLPGWHKVGDALTASAEGLVTRRGLGLGGTGGGDIGPAVGVPSGARYRREERASHLFQLLLVVREKLSGA